jgi:hypothetical protein
MEQKNREGTEEREKREADKEPYEAPRLVRLSTLDELTKGSGAQIS